VPDLKFYYFSSKNLMSKKEMARASSKSATWYLKQSVKCMADPEIPREGGVLERGAPPPKWQKKTKNIF
jgi:hypothetical protein